MARAWGTEPEELRVRPAALMRIEGSAIEEFELGTARGIDASADHGSTSRNQLKSNARTIGL